MTTIAMCAQRPKDGAAPSAATERAARDQLIGFAAAITAVTVWAGWFVATRMAVTSSLDPAALAFIRFAVPAIVLAPAWWRAGLLGPQRRPLVIAAIVCGGAPYFLAVATGMRFAPSTDPGTIIPGTTPLLVALISVALLGERLGRLRAIGLALVATGTVAVAGHGLVVNGGGPASLGHLLFLIGAACWAISTVALPRAGLSLWQGPALLSVWSALVAAPAGVPALADALAHGAWQTVLAQALMQGLVAGVFAFSLYVMAIRKLGASRAASFTALIPPMTAALAIPLLGEWPGTATIVGGVLTMAGVGLASGAISLKATRS